MIKLTKDYITKLYLILVVFILVLIQRELRKL